MSIKRHKGLRLDDGLFDLHGPIGETYGPVWLKAVKAPFREGVGYEEKHLQRGSIAYGWALNTETIFMNVIAELKTNYDEAEKLWSSYAEKLKAFRSVVKNDVVSLEAAARKTTEAVQKMNRAYSDVITQMNSDEMQRAVQNAERLAAAMTALASLQSHKLVFAVTDQSDTSKPR